MTMIIILIIITEHTHKPKIQAYSRTSHLKSVMMMTKDSLCCRLYGISSFKLVPVILFIVVISCRSIAGRRGCYCFFPILFSATAAEGKLD